MQHTCKLYYRYLQRSWGFNTKDLIAIACVIVVFALAYVWWIRSPTVKDEQATQRRHAIEFLQTHRYDVPQSELDAVMEAYQISPDEIDYEITPSANR